MVTVSIPDPTNLIEPIKKYPPSTFQLAQNYPNPFNPITNIEFRIPCLAGRQANSEFITLRVYNLVGEEVNTLLSASLPPGSYNYRWHASGLASGVYLYRLEAGEFVETKKMILMK